MTNYGVLAILALPPEKVSDRDLRLLLALETHPPDKQGSRLVRVETVAAEACLPVIAARRSRDRLVRAGLLSFNAGSGRGRYSTWKILLDLGRTPQKVLAYGDHLSEEEASQKGDHHIALTCGNDFASLKDKNIKDIKAKDFKTQLFEEFMEAYPRPGSRSWALPAWETAIASGADPAVLVDAARRYAKAGENPTRIPYPKRWLGERRWADWLVPAVKQQLPSETQQGEPR